MFEKIIEIKPKFWYKYYEQYCPCCGKTDVFKERQYTERPTRWEDRHEVEEVGCNACKYPL